MPDGHGYRLAYRAALPVEQWNAQLSLLCGMAAAELMLVGGWGRLRTLPPAGRESLDALRRQAVALGLPWPDGVTYADVIHALDPAEPEAAASSSRPPASSAAPTTCPSPPARRLPTTGSCTLPSPPRTPT